MSDRAWTILGVGVASLSVGLTVVFPNNKAIGYVGILVGLLITIYGMLHDRIRSNKVSVVFSADPPYTFKDPNDADHTAYRIGVRGSRRLPKDVKLLVTKIHSHPTEPMFRGDYPYQLECLSQADERELLFGFASSWISSVGDRIVCGIQKDARGEFEKIRMQPNEIWDVTIRVISTDSKPLEVWMMVAAVKGALKVRQPSHKPATL